MYINGGWAGVPMRMHAGAIHVRAHMVTRGAHLLQHVRGHAVALAVEDAAEVEPRVEVPHGVKDLGQDEVEQAPQLR